MREVPVLDTTMAYREVGAGQPFVLLHGNPTSSYEWRNVLPAVGAVGRALAPDLVGMGESGKPDSPYRFGRMWTPGPGPGRAGVADGRPGDVPAAAGPDGDAGAECELLPGKLRS